MTPTAASCKTAVQTHKCESEQLEDHGSHLMDIYPAAPGGNVRDAHSNLSIAILTNRLTLCIHHPLTWLARSHNPSTKVYCPTPAAPRYINNKTSRSEEEEEDIRPQTASMLRCSMSATGSDWEGD
ncbi:hypothetical protein FQN60_007872 [Etheostoma spectabile]|uniref:Uncharacterized protein n=1 Tax=Etheostoma spectabile TaxID=54343 RepID=A0A5J5CZG7_9PERO|nr:hypothetical protein FQN60_007872 [Etheostoma spectabile]